MSGVHSPVSESTDRASDPSAPAEGFEQPQGEGKDGDLLPTAAASAVSAATTTADVEPDRPTPPTTMRAFERALRALGYSQRQAAAIAKSGFRASEPDADDGIEQLREALLRNLASLKANHHE